MVKLMVLWVRDNREKSTRFVIFFYGHVSEGRTPHTLVYSSLSLAPHINFAYFPPPLEDVTEGMMTYKCMSITVVTKRSHHVVEVLVPMIPKRSIDVGHGVEKIAK